MKKLCIFLCLLLPLLSFVACGDDEPAETSTDNSSVQGIMIDAGETLTIGVNETKQLSALNRKDNSKTTVIWSSDNPSVVSVDYNGLLTGIADGTAIITATTPDESFTATCKVTVSSVLTGIAFDRPTLDMERGTEVTLTPVLTPSNITNVKLVWMTGDPKIATVSNGVVTAVGNGTTSIYVSDDSNKLTAFCTVNVTTTVTGVTLNVESDIIEMDKGATRQLIATLAPEGVSDPTVTWTSSNPDIVSVDQDGNVTALAGGAANITATSGNGISASCNIVVNSPVVGITLNTEELVIGVGETYQLIATIDPADANQQDVIWDCTDLSVLNVDNTGALLGQRTGTVTVTVMSVDGYFTASCTVTVINAATEIVFDSASGDLEIGKTMQLIPILTPEDADPPVLTWVSSDPTVATVDEFGNVTALTLGETTITATATNGVTATYSLRVVQLEIKIEKIIVDNILSVKVAHTFKMDISLLPTNCTEGYVIVSNDPSTIRVNADGTLTPLKAGVTTVTVSSKSGNVSTTCVVNVNALSDEERTELQAEYDAKAEALQHENETNLQNITTKYDQQIANINEIIGKLSISSKEEYETKRKDLNTRLEDAEEDLEEAIAEENQELIAVFTATRDALQSQIDNLDGDWETLSILLKNLDNNKIAKANELANENTRYQNELNKLKAEYAFLF